MREREKEWVSEREREKEWVSEREGIRPERWTNRDDWGGRRDEGRDGGMKGEMDREQGGRRNGAGE